MNTTMVNDSYGDITTWWNKQQSVGGGRPYMVLANGCMQGAYDTLREAEEVRAMYAKAQPNKKATTNYTIIAR
jgi:hypothetical protein